MAESRGFWQLDDSGQKSEGRRQKREVGSGNAEVGKNRSWKKIADDGKWFQVSVV